MTVSPQTSLAIILNTENDAALRTLISDALVAAGYRVVEATNADHALAVLSARPDVGLLVTDVVLEATMDGLALARAAAARRPDLAILVTSGVTEPASGDLPPHARLLPKPFTPSALLQEIRLLTA